MTFAILKLRVTLLSILTLMSMALLGCSTQNLPVPSQFPSSTLDDSLPTAMTQTLTPRSNNLPPSTATLTLLPTLEPNEATEALQQLLMEQTLCESPCFWGITPNQTTLEEAQNIFNRLGLHLKQTFQDGKKVFFATSFGLENGVVTSVVIRVQDGLIDSTRTNIGFTKYRDSSPLQETLAFSPKSVQSQYGAPTYVEFYISQAPSDGTSPYTISYATIMYFDSANLIIEYDSKLIKDESMLRICPLSDNFDGISVWQGEDAENAPTKEGVTLEMATSLSLKQFADSIAGDPEYACFDLNREKFR